MRPDSKDTSPTTDTGKRRVHNVFFSYLLFRPCSPQAAQKGGRRPNEHRPCRGIGRLGRGQTGRH